MLVDVQARRPLSRCRTLTALTLSLFLLFLFSPNAFASANHANGLIGPKPYYLALGDSLAFGYQPNFDLAHGYVSDFYNDLHTRGVTTVANMGCPGESSTTFVNGGCPNSLLRKYPYSGAQFNAALSYLASHAGQVSPVTLDLGANDVLTDLNARNCNANVPKFNADLATLDTNLRQVILPRLQAALTVNGTLTGDLLVMNYYDPYRNSCPNSLPYVQELNQHLAADVAPYGSLVDVFSAFGGAVTPNPNLCSYTWICSSLKDIHPRAQGYSTIASAFEATAGY